MPYEYHEAAVLCLTFFNPKNAAFYTTSVKPGNAVRSSITAEIVALLQEE